MKFEKNQESRDMCRTQTTNRWGMCSLRNVKLANEMIEGVSLICIKRYYYWRCTVYGVFYTKSSANGIA